MPSDERKLYNIKILQSFQDYLQEKLRFGDDAIEELFLRCGSHISALSSDDYWFDQEFSDRFYAEASKLANDDDLAYKVGEFSVSHVANRLSSKVILGFLTPSVALRNIQTLAKTYTKASIYEPIVVEDERALIRCRPIPNHNEKAYQCRNRQGTLEALPKFFKCREVRSNHVTCVHRGDEYCDYELRWTLPVSDRDSVVANVVAVALGFLTTNQLTMEWRLSVWAHILACLLMHRLYKAYRKLRLSLSSQNLGLQDSIQFLTRKNDEQLLVRQVIERTTEMMPELDLCRVTVESIQAIMKYDRVGLALVDEERKHLQPCATAGYDPGIKAKIESTKFVIRADNETGILVRVVNTNQPIFAPNINKLLESFSAKTQALVRASKTEALIAVPIALRDGVLGVLTIENVTQTGSLTVRDQELLVSIADHVAVAISNSRNFAATQVALRRSETLEMEQRQAKEQFEKYVPTAVRNVAGSGEYKNLTELQVREIAVMFIDIISFTRLSESMGPERVAELLGIYIKYINEIVVNTGGRINKIIGDGLMIYFERGEGSAIRTGFDILYGLPNLNARLKERGFEGISISIGAHMGPCTVGSIGYDKRLDFTIIGDTVNTAARIESKTRDLGPNIFLYSSSLIEDAKGFVSLPRGSIKLRGKEVEIELYQLLFPEVMGAETLDAA